MPHVKSGKLKAYAVTGSTRLASLPDVPTFAEVGMAEYDVRTWYGLLAPSATPRPILNKLSASVLDVLKMPDVQEKMRAMDMSPISPTPEQFAAMIKTEAERFAKIIKAANIKPVE